MARLITARWQPTLLKLGSILAFFALWEAVSRLGYVSPFLLPPPSIIAAELWDELVSGELPTDIVLTFRRMLIGLAIAVVVALPLGVGLARSKGIRWFFDPLLSIALPMPLVAFVPVFMLWLGVFDLSKIALISLSAVFPLIVQTWAGTQGIDKFMAWSAQSLGVRPRAFMWDIALPAALPQIFTGFQVALPIGLLTAVVTEMLMGGPGLGGTIVMGMRMSDSPKMFAGIVAVGICGFVLTSTTEFLRAKLLVWHQEAHDG